MTKALLTGGAARNRFLPSHGDHGDDAPSVAVVAPTGLDEAGAPEVASWG